MCADGHSEQIVTEGVCSELRQRVEYRAATVSDLFS